MNDTGRHICGRSLKGIQGFPGMNGNYMVGIWNRADFKLGAMFRQAKMHARRAIKGLVLRVARRYDGTTLWLVKRREILVRRREGWVLRVETKVYAKLVFLKNGVYFHMIGRNASSLRVVCIGHKTRHCGTKWAQNWDGA